MDFELFWNLYPRKAVKKPSRMVWDKLTEQDQQAAIAALPNHIEFWRVAGTTPEFIPHARTWLYQERWTDEIELPKPKVVEPGWWTSEQGILSKAGELGLTVRAGEGWFELKQRINEAIKKSA